MRDFIFIRLVILITGCIIALGCSGSKDSKNDDRFSFETSIAGIAEITGVDSKDLEDEVEELLKNSETISTLTDTIDYNVLACVADSDRNGRINLADTVILSKQLGRKCSDIAKTSYWNPDIEDNMPCMNLAYEYNLSPKEQRINLSDIAIYSVVINNYNSFSADYCWNGTNGDSDYLPPYIEAYAWVSYNPLSDDSDEDGINDFWEFNMLEPFEPYPAQNISAGSGHACVIINDGTIKCWGSNFEGQLGNGNNNQFSNVPVSVIGIDNAISVHAGFYHTCAILSNGKVKCWGQNDFGQLGTGTTDNSYIPAEVIGIDNPLSIAVGYLHTCALLRDSTIKCWGANDHGQLGNGTAISSYTPVQAIGLRYPVSVKANGYTTCALLEDEGMMCWGFNRYGNIGDGTDINSSLPVRVLGIENITSYDLSENHTCAVSRDGFVKCWGDGTFGQLGNGLFGTISYSPISVIGIGNAIVTEIGSYFSCAGLNDGQLKCWGHNGDGELANGNYLNSSLPVYAKEIVNYDKMSMNGFFGCYIVYDGSVKCWGDNSSGELGNGTLIDSNLPVQVQGINNARIN